MRKQLPSISLIDVTTSLDGTVKYRQRLAGTNLFNLYGREITGLSLAQIYPEAEAEAWAEQLDVICRDRSPAYGEHDLSWRGMDGVRVAWVRLPLSSNGQDVDMILGYDAVIGSLRISPSGVCAA